MAIPDYQTLMLPLLRFLGDEQEHTAREARERIARECHLDEGALREMGQADASRSLPID